MRNVENVFSRSYRHYVDRLGTLCLPSLADRLGGRMGDGRMRLVMYGDEYAVSADGIRDSGGGRPAYEICVILSRYLLMCPDDAPAGADWVHFRDFKDSGPLRVYFANDVEGAIARCFTNRPDDLKRAARRLGGSPAPVDVACDLAIRFAALPRIPVVMLYNDVDAEFAASCSLLFESRAQIYLDPECVAMLGRQLFARLEAAAAGQDGENDRGPSA